MLVNVLGRRAFLRRLGSSISLPSLCLLEPSKLSARVMDSITLRMGFAYIPNGEQTKLPSFELSTDHSGRSGKCDSGHSCAYQFNLSWKTESMPMSPESNPRLVFERLFGKSQ